MTEEPELPYEAGSIEDVLFKGMVNGIHQAIQRAVDDINNAFDMPAVGSVEFHAVLSDDAIRALAEHIRHTDDEIARNLYLIPFQAYLNPSSEYNN